MDCETCGDAWAQQLANDVEYHDPRSIPEGDYEELVAALWATQSHQDRLYLQQALPGLDLPQWPLVPTDEDT